MVWEEHLLEYVGQLGLIFDLSIVYRTMMSPFTALCQCSLLF